MHVCLNGRMVEYDRARIAHDDAGLLHGVGLFETMAARNGRVFRLRTHVRRLVDSAAALGLATPLDPNKLERAVQRTLLHNHMQRARVRLTVTAGRICLLADPPQEPATATTLVVASAPTRYDPATFEHGVMALIARAAANPFDPTAGHKTLAYWQRLATLRQAAAAGAGEAIWLNISNHLASGAVSNLFLVKDGTLLTPIARGEEVQGALAAPVLPGVTRAAVIALAAEHDLPTQSRMLDVNDLLEADEVFLTNSSWHLLPVTRVEKKTIADGHVGTISGQLRQAMLQLIEKETAEGSDGSDGSVGSD